MNPFMDAESSFDDAHVILLGCPYDGTCSYRPGSRFGPQAIREASYGLERWSPLLRRELTELAFHDQGDLELPLGDTQRVLSMIGEAAEHIHKAGKIPFGLGGEHLISLPLIRAAFQKYPDLQLIHLDAHADLREDYMGNPYSHATVFQRVLDFLPTDRLHQFGIRSGTREEYVLMESIDSLRPHDKDSIDATCAALTDAPVYISLDLDILDPGIFPGTGTPEPGGLQFLELHPFFRAFQKLNHIVGIDVVELSPPCDLTGTSNVVASKVCRELLLSILKE